jgi:hypothetical protein
MPLTALQPLVTARFAEVNALITLASSMESVPPVPDTDDVRALRGLLYVHLYAALEYSMDQCFIRLAQHLNSKAIAHHHLSTPIFGVALDSYFRALQSINALDRGLKKRTETMTMARGSTAVVIGDGVLSPAMQSATNAAIQMAFDTYGITAPPIYDVTKRGYIDEVVERRHAVAHGRESPVQVGVLRASELRQRYDVLYAQSLYVISTLNTFCAAKEFALPPFRAAY